MNIINSEKLFEQSENFKNSTPFKFAFCQNILNNDKYEKLLTEFPNLENFHNNPDMSKNQLLLDWNEPDKDPHKTVFPGTNNLFSNAWNEFKLFSESEECLKMFRDFSGVPVNKLKHFRFISYKNGGFQLPHAHNVGPSTLNVFFYFSPGWKHGEAGGTYMASEEDETKIIFEPYDLDNSMALFLDGPNSWHGTRMITNNKERKAVQLILESWSEKDGWSGDPQ